METQINTSETGFQQRKELKNIVYFFTGKLVSDFGTFIYSFVIGLYILKETGSSLSFASVMVFGLLPRIFFGPISGAIADRVDRKKLIVLCDIFCGILLIAFFVLFINGGSSVMAVNLLAFSLATLNTFFDTALNASIPNLVNEEKLTQMNSFNQSASSINQIITPVLGGVLFGWLNIEWFLLCNALSFFWSAAMLSRLKLKSTQNAELDHSDRWNYKKIISDISEGFAYIRGRSALLILFLFALIINFLIAAGIEIPVPFIVNEVIGLSPQQFGIISGAFPIGMLLGSLLLPILPNPKKKYKLFSIALILDSIGVILSGLPGTGQISDILSFYFYVALYFLLGFIVIFVNVPISTMLMTTTEDKYRGRVFGTLGSLSTVVTPLGLFVSGLLIAHVPAYTISFAAGFIQLVLLGFFIFNRSIKTL